MEEFTIGKVYTFTYESPHKNAIKTDSDRTFCQMAKSESAKLVKKLLKNAQKIQDSFELRLNELEPYFKIIKDLKKIKEERQINGKYTRKSDIEKTYEASLTEMKKKYFPKREISEAKQAQNAFIRNYDPERITITNEGTRAVYAGKSITSTGKIVHQWYNLSMIMISEKYVDEKYVDICYIV